ncbi:MAG: hypothetical protein NVSMB21_21090 [Vulcanimicrobiaceae bacterium]
MLETTVLGLWAGAMACFAFIVAPIAFRILPGMELFGTLTGAVIRGVGSFGNVCGALAIAASLARATAPPARRLAVARIALVAVALGASAYQSGTIVPRMDATAATIPGPIDSVPKTDPRRAAYAAQHEASTRVYGTAFVCVVAALALAAFGRRRSS